MKKTTPIILIMLSLMAASAQTILPGSVYFTNVNFDLIYQPGDSVEVSFMVSIDNKYNDSLEILVLDRSNGVQYDVLKFRSAVSAEFVDMDDNFYVYDAMRYVIKTKLPDWHGRELYRPRIHGEVINRGLNIGLTSAVLDETLDKSKEVSYYLDMNGRVVPEPKGLAIVVYTDGSRSKVIFE